MNAQDASPCPQEDSPEPGTPGKVDDGELVIRVVVLPQWLNHEAGCTTLGTDAFPTRELQGKRGASVSLLRPMTPEGEILRRAEALTKEPGWKADPVLGRALAGDVRTIVDEDGRREFCVNADVDDGLLGQLVTHASLLRSCPVPGMTQRAEWVAVRLKLGQAFSDIHHHSGAPVKR